MSITIQKDEIIAIYGEIITDFTNFLEKNPQFSLHRAESLGDKVCYIENETYVGVRYRQQKKFKMRDDKGVVRNYIWDKKDRIFKSKKQDRIVLPNICCLVEKPECADFYEQLGFTEGDTVFLKSALRNRAESLTGNHYRNKKNIVPAKAYGR